MLICIDVGNTNITIGFFQGDELTHSYRMNTKVRRTSDEYGYMLRNFLDMAHIDPSKVEGVIVSSVVPKVMHSFRNGVLKFLSIEPMIIGPGIKTGISVQLENPKSVGADRIADAAGAYYEYGGPVLVVDFGTAPTYDYVDENGCFKAGVIAGAATDVLENEPPAEDCPLLGLDNCIITPHLAWAPKEMREIVIDVLADNLKSWLDGGMQNRVEIDLRDRF